jgi:HEAT repeat protein
MARLSVPSLIKQLRGRNADASDRAASAMYDRVQSEPERFRDPALVSELMTLINHRSYGVRGAAINALDGSSPREAATRIARGLAHPDGKRRRAAAERLQQVVNASAENILGELKDSGREALLKAAYDENDYVRGSVLQALGTMQVAEAVPAMVDALNAESDFMQGDALLAIGKLGKRAAVAIPRLVALLDSSNAVYAAQALGGMGSAGAAAIAPLEKARAAAKEGDDELEETCADALKRLKRAVKK